VEEIRIKFQCITKECIKIDEEGRCMVCKTGYLLNKDATICVNIMNTEGLKLQNCKSISADGTYCEYCNDGFGIYTERETERTVCDTVPTNIENCWIIETQENKHHYVTCRDKECYLNYESYHYVPKDINLS